MKRTIILISIVLAVCLTFCGCNGYSNESLFSDEVSSIYVEMFDNTGFNRGSEYEFTDALAKRIEAVTPYKIVSSRDRADTIISGNLSSGGGAVLSSERETGRALENEVQVTATVNWKNLKTGELLIDNESVSATASYSEWQNQSSSYASALAANNLAKRIVELMEIPWEVEE